MQCKVAIRVNLATIYKSLCALPPTEPKIGNEGQAMKPELHTELHALCSLLYLGDISDEEWALPQVHMSYCIS
jgi:hypothetical protein